MASVKVKFEGRLLKIRPSSMTTRNLAMIFKLDLNRGIYLNCEEEGEIILPSGEEGMFEIEFFDKTYVVNGDVSCSESQPTSGASNLYRQQSPAQQLPMGIPLSYQPQTSRTSLNPPPCVSSHSTVRLQRPRFTTSASTSATNRTSHAGWKKSFTLVEINQRGEIFEKFQIHLNLNESSANVEGIEALIKGQLGYDVKLLDAKYLPVMAGEFTSGSQFWRSNRKIVVVKAEQAANARRKSGSKRKRTVTEAENILERLKRLVRSDSDDEADFADDSSSGISISPATLTLAPTPSRSNSTSPNQSTDEQIHGLLARIFKCAICLNPAKLPAAACSFCYTVIGCVPCIEQWYESSPGNRAKCPLCRTNMPYKLVPILREIAEILQQPIAENQTSSQASLPQNLSDNESVDTIPYLDARPSEDVYEIEPDEDLPVGLVD